MSSRQKGCVAERAVAKLIEEWWARVEPGAQFVRTPLSGGWGNPKLRGEFRASGDLMTKAKRWPFCVEVKRREAWSWDRLVSGKPSPVRAWWKQAMAQAEEMGAEPMLWLKHNREPWWVAMRVQVLTLDTFNQFPPQHRVRIGDDTVVFFHSSGLLESDPAAYAVREDP